MRVAIGERWGFIVWLKRVLPGAFSGKKFMVTKAGAIEDRGGQNLKTQS